MERNRILPPEDNLPPPKHTHHRISEQRRAQRRRLEGQPENETSIINASTTGSVAETVLLVPPVSTVHGRRKEQALVAG